MNKVAMMGYANVVCLICYNSSCNLFLIVSGIKIGIK